MKKSTNKYRKCANCPHKTKQEQRCCCQRSSASTLRGKALSSRGRKEGSALVGLDSTLPTIIADFSALRSENNNLRRELQSVSAFLKEQVPFLRDQTLSTLPSASNEAQLSQKLFIANKNLREALLEVDALSRMNKDLQERNCRLGQDCDRLRMEVQELDIKVEEYRRQCKKLGKKAEVFYKGEASRIQIALQEQNRRMREEIESLRFQSRQCPAGSLSPEWVAHTNHKLSRLEQGMGKLEETQLQGERQLSQQLKKALLQAVGVLKQGLLGYEGEWQSAGSLQLVRCLVQALGETVVSHCSLLFREISRKLISQEKKVLNLGSRLQNLLIVVRNRELKRQLTREVQEVKRGTRADSDRPFLSSLRF